MLLQRCSLPPRVNWLTAQSEVAGCSWGVEKAPVTEAPTLRDRDKQVVLTEQLQAAKAALKTQAESLTPLAETLKIQADSLKSLAEGTATVHASIDNFMWQYAPHLSSRREWQSLKDMATELQVTAAVKQHLGAQRCSVAPLSVDTVYDSHGDALVELDGLLIVKDKNNTRLALLEAKHRMTKAHVDETASKFERFRQFMLALQLPAGAESGNDNVAFLWSQDRLQRYSACEHVWFIGADHAPAVLWRYAQRQGFHVVSSDGSKYSVQEPIRPPSSRASHSDIGTASGPVLFGFLSRFSSGIPRRTVQ